MVHVPEAAGAGLDVPDDAVESLEDRVRVWAVEVGEDVLPVPAELSGEGLHRFRPRMHHPRAQCLGPGLRLRAVGSVGVDVLQAFAHPARPGGLRPPLRRIAPDLRLRVREVGLVPGPQALRPFQQAVLPGLGLAGLVDGLVGVFDDMEPVDGSGRVGRVAADALGESRAHVARHRAHAVRVAVERHEIPCEPFYGMRGLDLPGAVTLMAVAPDRVHVAGDRVHPPGFGMFDHPVVGGAGNARYPALRRYRVAGGVGPYHCYFRANTGDACSETSTSISNCLLRLRSSTGSFCSGGAVVGGFRGAAVADALDPTV